MTHPDPLQARDLYLNLLKDVYPELGMVCHDYITLPGIRLQTGDRIVFVSDKDRVLVTWLTPSQKVTTVGYAYNPDQTTNVETLVGLQIDYVSIASAALRISTVLGKLS